MSSQSSAKNALGASPTGVEVNSSSVGVPVHPCDGVEVAERSDPSYAVQWRAQHPFQNT